MAKNINELLQNLVGRTWMINATNHKITGYHINNDVVLISTDKEMITKPVQNIELFVKHEVLPVEDENKKQIVKFDDPKIKSVRETLMDSLEKIKDDETFIPKANAINSTVNTLLNTYKTELSLMKQLKGRE